MTFRGEFCDTSIKKSTDRVRNASGAEKRMPPALSVAFPPKRH
jgi:hypothetical protein